MEINQLAVDILKDKSLKKTPARLCVLNMLINNRFATGYADIEKATKHLADRITLYRILKIFEQKGIIHKTIDHEGMPKYAICHDNCQINHHRDNHVHFSCVACNQTICLEAIDIPVVQLPKGYQIQQINYNINGICRQCAR